MISAVMKGDLRYYRILFINCRVPIYRLHCIAVAGASKHFTAEASPCIDIRSHQAKSSTKLLNETVYSTRVSTFIIFVIQCVNNSMYCDFIYFLYCFHHRNCTFPCSALQTPIPDHRSQIKPAATGHRNKESPENGKLRQVIGRALWCANEQKKLKFPEICLWHKHI